MVSLEVYENRFFSTNSQSSFGTVLTVYPKISMNYGGEISITLLSLIGAKMYRQGTENCLKPLHGYGVDGRDTI